MISLNWLPETAYFYILIFARVGSILMLLPALGEMTIPARMRLGFALVFSLVLYPLVQPTLPTLPADPLTVLVYLIALPFVFIAGAGFIVFFIATAWLLGREYFELAAMRFRDPEEAKLMRKQNSATIFTAGLFIAAFVSIPVVNLATPLFGMAFMVHMHKRLSGPRPELLEPMKRTSVPTISS